MTPVGLQPDPIRLSAYTLSFRTSFSPTPDCEPEFAMPESHEPSPGYAGIPHLPEG